ncbi:nickel-dependent hydrogenase large subunit [Saccharolobus shibatae]|uniref:Uncharacterized protein n=1 Tax=Saccharolobus shibatae TaxID=2286 RepID=A0A8F5H0D9_9CREN|nr:nickel-dependent hydrogenase large subunit [Saccharolobus shibatae]QXJ35507.1 hypothetical protein J5U22_02054 [Saccharolobus shibatae]
MKIYKITLKLSTKFRDLSNLIWLRYPHPLSLRIGGIEVRDPNAVAKIKDGLKEVKSDLEKLFYIALELREFYRGLYKDIGADFVAYGLLESHDYNARYEEMDKWASKRFIPPALFKNGELVTRNLRDILLLGVRVHIESTAYESWDQTLFEDSLGNKVDLHHPWNKETKVKKLTGDYLFTVKQAIDSERFMLSTGDLARLLSYRTAKGKPKVLNYEWDYVANDVIERFFDGVFTVALLYDYIIKVEESKDFSQKSRYEENELAVGAHDAPRGDNAHWIIQKGGIILRYRIITLTDRNFSSNGGPVEKSIVGHRITEENEKIEGLDALRVIRSFDSCSACAVHIITLSNNIVKLL